MDVLFSSSRIALGFGLGSRVQKRCFMNKISLLMPGGRATRFSPRKMRRANTNGRRKRTGRGAGRKGWRREKGGKEGKEEETKGSRGEARFRGPGKRVVNNSRKRTSPPLWPSSRARSASRSNIGRCRGRRGAGWRWAGAPEHWLRFNRINSRLVGRGRR